MVRVRASSCEPGCLEQTDEVRKAGLQAEPSQTPRDAEKSQFPACAAKLIVLSAIHRIRRRGIDFPYSFPCDTTAHRQCR